MEQQTKTLTPEEEAAQAELQEMQRQQELKLKQLMEEQYAGETTRERNYRKIKEKINASLRRKEGAPTPVQKTKHVLDNLLHRASQDRKLFKLIQEEANQRGLLLRQQREQRQLASSVLLPRSRDKNSPHDSIEAGKVYQSVSHPKN